MNNDINKKILEKVKLKLAISTFDERENVNMDINKKSFFKTAAVACCATILTSGLVFATESSDNVIDYTQTFNLTKYDATDKVTVVLVTNMDKKIEIVLEK